MHIGRTFAAHMKKKLSGLFFIIALCVFLSACGIEKKPEPLIDERTVTYSDYKNTESDFVEKDSNTEKDDNLSKVNPEKSDNVTYDDFLN